MDDQTAVELSVIRRLLMEYGWDSVGSPVDRLKVELQRREKAERCVESLSVMLGWMHVPPQDSLEMSLRALKARAMSGGDK